MGCGNVTVKTCVGLLSVFFWLCAIALIVIGGLILGEYGQIQELAKSTDILIPSVIVIGAGVFLFIVGLVGCIGGMKGNKAALTIFFIVTLLVVVGEVCALALGYHYKDKISDKLEGKLHQMIKDCSNSSKPECDEVYFIQRKLQCCGADNYTDWFRWAGDNATVPKSCCIDEDTCNPPSRYTNETVIDSIIYGDSCSDKLISFLKEEFQWILIGVIVVIILQVLGLVATCVMLFKSKETPYSSLDSQGYRV